MKRKCISLLVCLLLLSMVLTAVAAAGPRVVDDAGLLSQIEIDALTEQANAIAEEYDMDVVIVTVGSLDGKSAQDFADDYYDNNGYGIGGDYSGVLFLLAMESREWWISTCGDSIYALTDYGIEAIGARVMPYFSDGDYFDGFRVYLDELEGYFGAFRAGSPIDGYWDDYEGSEDFRIGETEERVYYKESEFGLGNILMSLVIGVAAGGITVLIMANSMNTRRQQRSAAVYVKTGSYHLRGHSDMFLYSNVSKIRRQDNNGGSRGGGSSVHRSSGGRSHGGGGGRF